jgi:hypothetical protein
MNVRETCWEEVNGRTVFSISGRSAPSGCAEIEPQKPSRRDASMKIGPLPPLHHGAGNGTASSRSLSDYGARPRCKRLAAKSQPENDLSQHVGTQNLFSPAVEFCVGVCQGPTQQSCEIELFFGIAEETMSRPIPTEDARRAAVSGFEPVGCACRIGEVQ